jgi:poly-D-alanine transfer protein DltD
LVYIKAIADKQKPHNEKETKKLSKSSSSAKTKETDKFEVVKQKPQSSHDGGTPSGRPEAEQLKRLEQRAEKRGRSGSNIAEQNDVVMNTPVYDSQSKRKRDSMGSKSPEIDVFGPPVKKTSNKPIDVLKLTNLHIDDTALQTSCTQQLRDRVRK